MHFFVLPCREDAPTSWSLWSRLWLGGRALVLQFAYTRSQAQPPAFQKHLLLGDEKDLCLRSGKLLLVRAEPGRLQGKPKVSPESMFSWIYTPLPQDDFPGQFLWDLGFQETASASLWGNTLNSSESFFLMVSPLWGFQYENSFRALPFFICCI